jgi:type VI secretion system protein ImpK
MAQGNPFLDDDDDTTIIGVSIKSTPKTNFNSAPNFPPPESIPIFSNETLSFLRKDIVQNDNLITNTVMSLLLLAGQLRNTATHPDVTELRNSIINEIKTADVELKKQHISPEQIQCTNYVLCTLIDEIVLNTPWGANSIWAVQGLLVTFHGEAWGGEKFFKILDKAIQQSTSQLHLLELLYFCLCLGFEGQYKIREYGLGKLEEIRGQVYQILQHHQEKVSDDLAVTWKPIENKNKGVNQFVPLWVIGTVSGLLLTFVLFTFLYLINVSANPILSQLYALEDDIKSPQFVTTQVNSVVSPPDLSIVNKVKGFLENEIRLGQVTVQPNNDKTLIRIVSKDFFASGSSKITDSYYPLLDKIIQELSQIAPSRVSIVGHTDNVPIFSAKFPSNWDLSKARAQAVADLFIHSNQLSVPVVSEGRAETQPIVDNDTVEHRAMNRRIEIIF